MSGDDYGEAVVSEPYRTLGAEKLAAARNTLAVERRLMVATASRCGYPEDRQLFLRRAEQLRTAERILQDQINGMAAAFEREAAGS